MLLWTSGHLLGFLCVLMTRTPGVHHHHAVQNDATESLDAPAIDTVQDGDVVVGVPNNQSVNRARNGGRQRSGGDDAPRKGGLTQSQVGCRELRSTKYISDGQCTSINPIKELVCAGECLPSHLLPNWIGATNGAYGGAPPPPSSSGKRWSARDAQEWRCVIDRTRTQRIRLQCQDGSSRTYKITVVTSCKCKRYSRQQNDSSGHKTEGGGGGGGGGGHGSKDQSRSSKRRNKEQRKAGLPEDWAEEQS